MRDKINQPVNAASKEQSDFDVARGVYAQLRQGVEPKSLLEQVDDATCATSGKSRSRMDNYTAYLNDTSLTRVQNV